MTSLTLQRNDLITACDEDQVLRHLLNLTITGAASTDSDGRVRVLVTKTQIAEAIGSTREVVSKMISEFKDEGVLEPLYGGVVLQKPVNELAGLL